MGVWLGPRGKRDLTIDLNSFAAKGYMWNGTDRKNALAPTLAYNGGVLDVSITKEWTGDWETGWGNDKAGIAVSGPLDLTKYSKISVDFSNLIGSGNIAVYVSTSNADFDRSRDTVYQLNFSSSPVELDVSALAGTYYFGIAIEATGHGSYTTTFTKSVTINSVTATA